MWEGWDELEILEGPGSSEGGWRLLWILCEKNPKSVYFSAYSSIHPRSCNPCCFGDMHCWVHGEKQGFSQTSLQYKEHRDFCIGQICRPFDETDSQLSQLNLLQVVQQSTYPRGSHWLFTALFPIFCLHQYLLILLNLLLPLLSLSSLVNPSNFWPNYWLSDIYY